MTCSLGPRLWNVRNWVRSVLALKQRPIPHRPGGQSSVHGTRAGPRHALTKAALCVWPCARRPRVPRGLRLGGTGACHSRPSNSRLGFPPALRDDDGSVTGSRETRWGSAGTRHVMNYRGTTARGGVANTCLPHCLGLGSAARAAVAAQEEGGREPAGTTAGATGVCGPCRGTGPGPVLRLLHRWLPGGKALWEADFLLQSELPWAFCLLHGDVVWGRTGVS